MREQLPAGWVRTTIGEIADLNPRSFASEPFEDELVSFVPMAAVEEESGRLDPSTSRPWGNVSKGYTRFQEGDVLFAKITPCMENGKIVVARGLVGGRGAGSTEFHVVRAAQEVDPQLLYYLLVQTGVRRAARMKMKGAAGQLRVPPEFLSDFAFNLPPQREQERIVQGIEEQFTRLDFAVAALRRVRVNLKRYRAAVLKAACEGRLVPTEAELAREAGRSYETGEQLLSRILKERRANWEANQEAKMVASGKLPQGDDWRTKYRVPVSPDTTELRVLPEGWIWASIDQISICLDGQRVPVNKEERLRRGGDIPYYGANGRVGFIDDYLFDEPLVLVVEDETFIGRRLPFSYLIEGRSWVNNHAHVLRPTTAVTAEFLSYSLAFYPFTPMTTGSTGRRKLTQKALLQAQYPLPPIAEQIRIASEVERMLSIADEIDQALQRDIERADRLRQSVLKRAFEGKLVAQDANDEAASVLLERIRAERDSAASKPKSRAFRSNRSTQTVQGR